MPRTKKNHIAQNEDPRFHNTYQLLKHYRDATYSLKVVVHQLETQFQIDYGTSIDHFLDSIYVAGADLNGSDIEERAKSIERSNKMLKLLDSAVDLLRSNHKYGEQYYWILYYSFLSPQELRNTQRSTDHRPACAAYRQAFLPHLLPETARCHRSAQCDLMGIYCQRNHSSAGAVFPRRGNVTRWQYIGTEMRLKG